MSLEPNRDLSRYLTVKGITMTSKSFSRHCQVVVSLIFGTVLAIAPGTARAGFLEDLFGGGVPSAPATQSAPAPEAGPATSPDFGLPIPMHREHRRPKKKVAAAATTPVLQKTTALMDDKTLRPGDAVMMKTGVHVYTGPEASHHDVSQFVALDSARHLSSQERGQLIAMDITRRDPLEYVASNRTILQEGRSAGEQPIVTGYKITDARGRSIRYIGP